MKQFIDRHLPRISSNPIISRLVWLCTFLILHVSALVIALSAQVTATNAAHHANVAASEAAKTAACINELLKLAAPISKEDRAVQDRLVSDEYTALTGPQNLIGERLLIALKTDQASRAEDDAARSSIHFGGC